jgi:hypothetical protein
VRGCDGRAMRRLVRGRARSARQALPSRRAGVGLRVAQSDLLILLILDRMGIMVERTLADIESQFMVVVNRRSD